MPPKFQSSFIPKGPISAPMQASQGAVRRRPRDIVSMVAVFVFSLSVLSALGVFLYVGFLNYRVKSMTAELDRARAALSPETVNELVRLDDRIVSTGELIRRHRVLSPLFNLLESSTPRTVRFTEFDYRVMEDGPKLSLKGEAAGYAALALQADIFNKSPYLKNPVFSDLTLDERGNVVFVMTAALSPELLSYEREVNALYTPEPVVPVGQATSTPAATSTSATSTPN